MSKYVVIHKSAKIIFAILDKGQYRTFKQERSQEDFEVFKVSDKEANQFRIDQGLCEDSVQAYYMDDENESVLITLDEESEYYESLSYSPIDMKTQITNILKIIDDEAVKFSQEERETILSYLHKLYRHTVDEEFIAMKDEEEDCGYSIFNDIAMAIDLVLKNHGYIGRDYLD